ncbi:cardiolipin synthase [Cytobacillus oceanisediminis]|uniref:Cardiolipin synthase n=1 Tax=Cytobacillus oceanisediminis TaxID=665099 RepID=A0A2V3A5M1_9BACI|nr:phospholipase D family protein [Cytobacillus oceanisediminis]PWW32313.1 cardiolipin synthase [Cytobacillus oceanisediminis]
MTIQVLATGSGWLGSGIESIQSNVIELIRNCKHELIIGSYSFGLGGLEIIPQIEKALKRNVSVSIFINNFYQQDIIIQEELKKLKRITLNMKIYNFKPTNSDDLHAKLIIADRTYAIIGSSNLSKRGFISNHELAVLIKDREVSKIASAFDRLKLIQYVNEIEL